MTFVVRAATNADLDQVADVYLESWRAGYADLLEPDILDQQLAQRASYNWQDAIARDRVLVVTDGARVAGVAHIKSHHPSDRGLWIEMFYVRSSAWGTGAATALLDAVLSDARASGHEAIWLNVVEEQERARRFYERQGWHIDIEAEPQTNGLFPLLTYRMDLS